MKSYRWKRSFSALGGTKFDKWDETLGKRLSLKLAASLFGTLLATRLSSTSDISPKLATKSSFAMFITNLDRSSITTLRFVVDLEGTVRYLVIFIGAVLVWCRLLLLWYVSPDGAFYGGGGMCYFFNYFLFHTLFLISLITLKNKVNYKRF